jgi:pyruvate dehydrogenase E1 component alpha subunit/2-oxoisovalerate dehydrogenase E1 component alpha subunit
MGAQPTEILRQYMAKAQSPTRGREMNIHFNSLDLGYLGQISPLGDMVPVMAGITLSFKMRGELRVGMVYIGDGGTSTGAFHEGTNLAAVQRLPLVIVIEHNGYAYSTPTSAQTAVDRLAKKATAYGIPGVSVNGNDVFAVYEATKEAVATARRGGGTTIIEVVTYRRKGHAEHDDQRYQPKDEIKAWEQNDPVTKFETTILDRGWADQGSLTAIHDRVDRELEVAVESCENDPLPDPESALGGVYKEEGDIRPLWFRRADG